VVSVVAAFRGLLPSRVASHSTGGKRELTSISVIERKGCNAGNTTEIRD
jgi:hypothetical protein